MEKPKNFNESSFIFKHEIWITDIAISSILAVISLYLSVALLYHKLRVKKLNEKKFLQLPLHEKYRALSKFISNSIAIASFIGNSVSAARLVLEGIGSFYKVSWPQDLTKIFCGTGPKLLILGYCICSFLVIVFLWLRQSIFYVHPSLGIMNFTSIKRFSLTALIVYTLGEVAICIAFLTTMQYRYIETAGICIIDVGNYVAFTILISFWILIMFLMQSALLGLFIYLIRQRILWRGQEKDERNVYRRKKAIKAAILASICAVSDWVSTLVLYLLFEKNPTIISFPFAVNLLINLLVTIACFDCWKELIWPWSKKLRKLDTDLTTDEALFLTTNFTVPDHTSIKEISS